MRLQLSRHIILHLSQLVFFLVAFNICQPNLAGQTIAVSQDVSLKNDQAYFIVGKFGETILLMRDQETEVEIHAFDDELREKWTRTVEYEKKNSEVFSVVNSDTSFHVIYGYREKGDYYIMERHYLPNLTCIDTVIIDEVKDMFFAPKVIVVVSEDSRKVLIFRIEKDSELHASVYDLTRQEILWEKVLLFQDGSLSRNYRDVLLSNNGDMFLILDHDRNSYRNRRFVVHQVNARDVVLRKRMIDLNGLVAFDLEARYDNINETLWLAGMYSEKPASKLLGLYTVTLGAGIGDANSRIISFDDLLLEEVNGGKGGKKKGVQDFIVRDIILRQDGGALLLAEMSKEYMRRPSGPTRTVDYSRAGWVDYYYEDVVAFSIHPDGTEHWNTVLHKKQYSQDDNAMYSSFFIFKTPEKIRLLFNDEIRQNSTVSEYVIRGNGYHKRSSVFSTDYQRLKLRFRDGVQVAYNECLIPSERSNRLNLVRITFDE